MRKTRLDILLVERGLVESLQRAQRLIMAGQVLVDDRVVDKPGNKVPEGADLIIREGLPYVSRGGIKLEHALDRFQVDVTGKTVADVGASTGGFTDCLLQRGALRVYAIDVGYGQLAWRLRQDPRVVVLDRTNIRYLEDLADPVDLATIDVAFISLRLVLPRVVNLLQSEGEVVALVKPQFEAAREQVGRGGVVKDPAVHRQVLEKAAEWAMSEGLRVRGLTPSPLRGPAGNVEFFVYLSRDEQQENIAIDEAISASLVEAESL
ncbi:MAG: TlyA family rRNA (cytidine-2'-O)-methyltransferase [Chloroflexi bacterium B3_Chlor]|nr:MAG: TlyA family rRNA (cytidine-2'-O)-methyltransferase [Chloroflexi bacterium B3_Chlor]